MFHKKGVLKNFAKFTGKYLCRSLFFNKVKSLKPATLLKRDSGTGVFLWNWWNFQDYLFDRTPPGDCFCILSTTLKHFLLLFICSYWIRIMVDINNFFTGTIDLKLSTTLILQTQRLTNWDSHPWQNHPWANQPFHLRGYN